jgi:DnaJ homolog subfamily C member 28
MPNIEELMRRAMAEGKFDDLPGKGKPLHLDQSNPHADPEWELAFKMLKDSGYSLPWIETIREIEKDIEAARQDFRLAWEWRQAGSSTFADWERSQNAFKDKLAALNKRIRDYNLEVPNARFQRPVMNYEMEVGKIIEE